MCRPEGYLHFAPIDAPYAARWSLPHRWHQTSNNTLLSYRDQLDNCPASQFAWCPYPPYHLLPDFCLAGQMVYQCRVPLVYLYVVEWHYPDQVVRQFGWYQTISRPVQFDSALPSLDGKKQVDIIRGVHNMVLSMKHEGVMHPMVDAVLDYTSTGLHNMGRGVALSIPGAGSEYEPAHHVPRATHGNKKRGAKKHGGR